MGDSMGIMHYWGGCPRTPNSKWQRFRHLLVRCRERGWRTYLVWSSLPDDPRLSKPFTDAGCEIILQPRARRNFDVGCAWRTYRLLRRLRCDVFHCHNVHTSPLIGAGLAGVPARVWSKLAMSPFYERGTRRKGHHRWSPSTRVSAGLAHRVLARSTAVRDELIEEGAAPAKLLVWPPEIDVELYGAADGRAMRSALGIGHEELVISAVGHAVPVKGWDVLIRAFAAAAAQSHDARLLLIGSCTDADERETTAALRALAEKLGVGPRVRLTGSSSDIPGMLAATDVFVMPSRSEGLPSALLEAMAAGCPVIGARVGGIPEVVRHGVTGLLFEREDHEELAAHLLHLMEDAGRRRQLALEGKASVAQYSLAASTDRMLALYDELLGMSASGVRSVEEKRSTWKSVAVEAGDTPLRSR